MTGAPVCTVPATFALAAQSLTVTAGTYTVVFQAMATTVGDFKISCTSGAAATVTFDTLSLKQINGGNLTVQGRVLVGNGTAAAPGYSFISQPTHGLFIHTDSTLSVSSNGARRYAFSGNGLYGVTDTSFLAFGVSADAVLARVAALPTWGHLGGANAAAPVAQTLTAQGCRGGTDSDCAGKQMTVGPTATSGGTGLGLPAGVTLNRGLITTTGTGAQGAQQAFITCGTKTLSTTSATAQTVATITTTTTSAGGVQMFYTVTASDGTNVDVDSANVSVSWNNLAATVAATMSAAFGGSNSSCAPDTLTSVPTATVATNVVSIKLTPTWVEHRADPGAVLHHVPGQRIRCSSLSVGESQ